MGGFRLRHWGMGALVVLAGGASCAPQLDTTRAVPPRGTIGAELFGVVCDRVGAQALHEDLTGGSFHAICHPAPDGTYADTVDLTQLPAPDPNAVDVNGTPVSLDQQNRNRAYAVARIQALARRRADLIAALDATFPDVPVPIKDTGNPDPTQSCKAPAGIATDNLGPQLADLLGRFTPLYDDGTIPHSTEALGRLMQAFRAGSDVQDSYTHFDSRQGYRPLEVALGAERPMLAYPALRDFANATLSLISADSNPYDPNPKYDAFGNRLPEPGPNNPQLSAMLAALYQELRTTQPDNPPVAPLLPVQVDGIGRQVLSRPRTNLEFMQQLFYSQDPAFGNGGNSAYIVQRDTRGYASVALVGGALPAPFVDMDGDGLPDVNPLGQFITSGGQTPPTPFRSVDLPDQATRDSFGRALTGTLGSLVYDYIDTSHVFAASMMSDMKPLMNPDTTQMHETVMDAMSGARVLFGSRDGKPLTTRTYAPDPSLVDQWNLTHGGGGPGGGAPPPAGLGTQPVTLTYDAFHAESSPLLDLVYALGNILADPTADDTLQYTKALFVNDLGDVARLAGDGLTMKAAANRHAEAQIPPTSTLWDEMLDVAVQIEKEPGLLEDLLRAFGDDAALPLAQAFSNYSNFDDQVTYDKNNLNGPPYNLTTMTPGGPMVTPVDRTQPDVGFNRSGFQRFVQAVHDTNGLTVCNKDMALMDAQVPILGSIQLPTALGGILYPGHPPNFAECEVLKISNAAKFYLDAVIGKAQLWVRSDPARQGICVFGQCLLPATVDLIQQSSGITGFFDPGSSQTLRPQPQFLNRLMFFDVANDSPNQGDPNYTTNHFLSDLQGNLVGSSICPERVIPDPCAPGNNLSCTGAPNQPGLDFGSVDPDGMVHGLRQCSPQDMLYGRDKNTIFTWEQFGFYPAITPILNAFANHGREDLFIDVLEVLHRHWASGSGDPEECKLSTSPSGQVTNCTKDGAVTYEPLLVEDYAGDILPAMHDLTKKLQTITIPHCTAVDPTSHQCTASTPLDGITVMANALRALLDPDQATAVGLADRHGNTTGLRNDGTTNPQVTPVYLLTEALNSIDAAFVAYANTNPKDNARQAQWRSARSQLVDQFLNVYGMGTSSAFANVSFSKITPILIDTLRAQLFANCQATFSPTAMGPAPPCDWARTGLVSKMQATMDGPTFAASMDLVEALRQNETARTESEKLLTYLLDQASQNDALPSFLASMNDMIQSLRDDTNLIPVYHWLATATSPSLFDTQGNLVQKGLLDAQLALMGRIVGRATDAGGNEICANELDPNQVIAFALQHLVTPMMGPNNMSGETPLEVIFSVVADVNRAAPDQTGKLAAPDYANIADNVTDFFLNKERGLEQLYAVIRNGTEGQ